MQVAPDGVQAVQEREATTAVIAVGAPRRAKMGVWEPFVVFLVTLGVLLFFTQRVVAYLTPTTGDEPFYLMTAISILQDGDLNECNNYAQHDEAQLYPAFYSFDGSRAYAAFPSNWVGWRGAPFPLPPHAGHIVPASRQCSDNYLAYPVDYNNPTGELYSKHGLGLSLLVLPAFALGGRLSVVFFLNLLGALLAANIYLFAREGTGKMAPAILTWVAFAFTVPLLPYSYLIFPELPAALLILYAFRRVRLMDNNPAQMLAIGLCVAVLPWFHYRFAPVSVGLVVYYFFQDRGFREKGRRLKWALLMTPAVLSAMALALFFYQRYELPFPNPADHAGISDVAGTLRGAAGLFLDQQWGLFVAAPIFILTIVGVILMAQTKGWRSDVVWIGIVALPYTLVIANYAQWWGEWCPPARYLAPVLPLLALPFAFVLDNIHSILYKAIYGVLLLLSLLTTWGFLYQPQWAYNQPDGKSLLLLHGLPELGSVLGLPLGDINATQYLPSFVAPYFAYYKGKELGDAAAQAAWRASIGPLIVIAGIVALCLILAYYSKRREGVTPAGGADSAGGSDSRDAEPLGAGRPAEAIGPVTFRLLSGWRRAHGRMTATLAAAGEWSTLLFVKRAPRPALAWVHVPVGRAPNNQHFRIGGSGTKESEGSSAVSNGSEGHRRSPWLPYPPPDDVDVPAGGINGAPHQENGTEVVTRPPVVAAPVVLVEREKPAAPELPASSMPAQEPVPVSEKKVTFLGVLWRTRGLWLGLVAVGLAMYAQKLTTVDRNILQSIHWYILAIAVLIVGWLGTYKNRSFLVMPVPREKKAQVSEDADAEVATSPNGVEKTVEAVAAVDVAPDGTPYNGINGAEEGAQTDWPVAPLPTRKRAVIETTPQVIGEPPEDGLGMTSGLPVRVRSARSGDANGASPSPVPLRETADPAAATVVTPVVSSMERASAPVVDEVTAPAVESAPVAANTTIGDRLAPQVVPAPAPAKRAFWQRRERRERTSPSVWARIDERIPGIWGMWWRYALAFVALGINIYSVQAIRHDYYSAIGSWGWVFSLVLLLVAFFGERKRAVRDVDSHTDIIEQTDSRISRKLEIAIFLVIFLMGLGLRLLNLGDMSTGMHGDEGEAGMDAINILEGNRVSPFLTGWFLQPNFYYWGIALTMKVFGTDLFGLRMFSAMAGSLLLLPFYGLVRMWFGVRTAIIAGLLLAFSDVAIHFSKAEFSNITTPLFLTTGFYFLFKGLRHKRTLDFVLSGYGFMLSLYFYMGARLTPFMVLAVIGYMFLLMPIVRIPGAYFDVRKVTPGLGRLRALGKAISGQARSVLHYFGQLLVFAIACFCFAGPWLVYYLDNQAGANSRTNEKLIFYNEPRMAGQYAVQHEPLYLGIRMPNANDVYPFMPIVFEQTPTSVQVSQDGFWPRVMWDQFTTTLSIFTYRWDASSVYTFTNEPVSKPIEAALLILGIAWALWRWRDTRMGVISIWFWSTVIAGGVLTIDAPYMARMVGLIPVMAIAIALPLTKLAAEFLRLASILARKIKAYRPRRIFAVSSQAFSASVVGVLLLYLALQNYGDYFLRYTRSNSFPEVTGQSAFVRQMNQANSVAGRPVPYYYDLGTHFIYWGHGDNRFLNHGTPGTDMVNGSNNLPILDNDNRDVIFMVWSLNAGYLDVIKRYYPDGEQGVFQYSPQTGGPMLFNYYRVTKEQIEARRRTLARYAPATGTPIERDETAFGTSEAPPTGLSYPMQASWHADLVAPSIGRYKFTLDTVGAGGLVVDGTPVLTTTEATTHAEGELLLARGPHEVLLSGTLADAASQVNLQWSLNGQTPVAIPRTYLWNGPGRDLTGEIYAYTPDLLNPQLGGVLSTRVDGFLGFRDSPAAMAGGGGFTAVWTGSFDVKDQGTYGFDVNSNGDSIILIDGNMVVNNIRGGFDPRQSSGQVDLAPGEHSFELRYNWSGGTGYMEAFWTPPNQARTMLGPGALHTDGGIVDSTKLVSEPPPVQITPEAPPATLQPDGGISGEFIKPRGLAVDKQGNIYVADRGESQIMVFSPDGKLIHKWGKAAAPAKDGQPPPPLSPEGGEFAEILDVAIGEDGLVYVFDNAPRVQAFTPEGEFKGSIEPGDLNVYGPNGIGAVSTAGAPGLTGGIMIAVTGQSRILRLPSVEALKGGQVTVASGSENITISEGDSLEQPVDVAADPSGSGMIYAIDLKDRIIQLTPHDKGDGTPRTWTIGKQWGVLVGRDDGGSRLAVSADGKHVYMSDPDRQRVAVLDVASGKISYFGGPGHDSGQFSAPSGIAVGPNGKVYVLDRENNNVQIFDISKLK